LAHLQIAADQLGAATSHLGSCDLDDDAVRCAGAQVLLSELAEAARTRGILLAEARKAYGSPRSVAFNAQGFRVAVHRMTGEIRVLHSVQATDAGVVINPEQVRGQVEGGVVQGLGFVKPLPVESPHPVTPRHPGRTP
jgi:putative selenate reductase molybdopterin-binding subunit